MKEILEVVPEKRRERQFLLFDFLFFCSYIILVHVFTAEATSFQIRNQVKDYGQHSSSRGLFSRCSSTASFVSEARASSTLCIAFLLFLVYLIATTAITRSLTDKAREAGNITRRDGRSEAEAHRQRTDDIGY